MSGISYQGYRKASASQKLYQADIISRCKTWNNIDAFPMQWSPHPYCTGKPKLENFYLKPVTFFVPHKTFIGYEVSCPECQDPMHSCGVAEPLGRYVHDLKGGKYLLQWQYECKNKSCSVGKKVATDKDILKNMPHYIQ